MSAAVCNAWRLPAGLVSGKPAVTIFDVDGTLADIRPLRHLLVGKGRNLDAFHRASAGAAPNERVVEALRAVRRRGDLAFVATARDGKWAGLTLDWLARHDIAFDGFCHREHGDNRPDGQVKAEVLDWVSRHHRVVGAYDDRPSVVRLWHAHAIPVTIVGGWFGDTDPAGPPPMLHVPAGLPLPARYAEED